MSFLLLSVGIITTSSLDTLFSSDCNPSSSSPDIFWTFGIPFLSHAVLMYSRVVLRILSVMFFKTIVISVGKGGGGYTRQQVAMSVTLLFSKFKVFE